MTSSRCQPIFSVVIPTYNRAHLLPRAIHSVLNQSFSDFELLIVDDCSTDQTEQVVRSFKDDRITYIRRDQNGGAPATRNTGIQSAGGEYIAFLDDDDEYEEQYLTEMHMAFTGAANTVGLGWCGTCFVRDSDQGEQFVSEQVWQPHYASREEAYLSFLHSRHIGTNCGVMIRKLCFDKVGLFDERCIGGAEDTEFFIRFVRSFDFLVVPDTLIKIHLHQGSHLRAYSDKKAKDYELIIQKNLTALQQHPQLWISKHYKTAWLFYYGGNKAKARQYMKLALRPTFLQPKIWLTWLTFEILGVWGPTLHRKVSSWKELASMKVSSGSSQN